MLTHTNQEQSTKPMQPMQQKQNASKQSQTHQKARKREWNATKKDIEGMALAYEQAVGKTRATGRYLLPAAFSERLANRIQEIRKIPESKGIPHLLARLEKILGEVLELENSFGGTKA
jgi:flagellar biosynthesis/type III secretory pathway protein FliH